MAVIHQINVSDGGVPKTSVDDVMVNERGVVGDRQEDTVHHGSPDQALCLYSLEVIERFKAEGHPIEPGFAGENLTISGLDWSSIEPGARLRSVQLSRLRSPSTPRPVPRTPGGSWTATSHGCCRADTRANRDCTHGFCGAEP